MEARAPRVAALIEADRYGPSELIAAASTAQALHCPCFVVLLRVARQTGSAQSSVELINRQFAETLGAIVVECLGPNPVDAASCRASAICRFTPWATGRPAWPGLWDLPKW